MKIQKSVPPVMCTDKLKCLSKPTEIEFNVFHLWQLHKLTLGGSVFGGQFVLCLSRRVFIVLQCHGHVCGFFSGFHIVIIQSMFTEIQIQSATTKIQSHKLTFDDNKSPTTNRVLLNNSKQQRLEPKETLGFTRFSSSGCSVRRGESGKLEQRLV